MPHSTTQFGLFDSPSPPLPRIAGLAYRPAFVTAEEETQLLAAIEQAPWRQDFKRRTLHYGYHYDYRDGTARPATAIPNWLAPLCGRLVASGHFALAPEQVLINEYLPGQGIAPHIDRPAFGGTVASLSLGSDCVMRLQHAEDARQEEIVLERRSLLVLSGDARYRWLHGIAPRKTDRTGDRIITRARRVSFTFRNLATGS